MKTRIALSFAIALACSTTLLAADNFKPLPVADLSKLSKENAEEVRRFRDQFEKDKGRLNGVELAEAYGNVGAVHARVGLFEVAEVAFMDAIQAAPMDGRWPYLLGMVKRLRGTDAEVRQNFEKAFKLNPDYLPIRMAVVNSMIRAGDLDRARALLDEHVARSKTSAMPYAILGDIAVQQKRYVDAIAMFKAALAAEPQANELYAALAYAQEQAGNKSEAAASKAKVGDSGPTLPDPILQRIMPIVDLKLAKPAASASAATPPPSPANPKNAALVESSLISQAGQYDEARKRLEAALKLYPNDGELLIALARVEATAGRIDAARARARAATTAAPKDANIWYAAGVIEESSGDDAAARTAYDRALAADKGFVRAQLAIGNIAARIGQPAEAMKSYRAALAVAPDSTNARVHVIAAQVLQNQCSEAIRETGEAATRKPRDAGVAELYVRVASTCPAANAEQRKRALTIAENLYKSPAGGSAQVSEAYALALAASGRWKEAQETQGAAIFDALNKGASEASLALYRDFYKQFEAKKLPDKPWPAAHPLYKPVRATFATQVPPAAKPTAAAPASVKPAAPAKPPVKK